MPTTDWKLPSQIDLVPSDMDALWNGTTLPMQASAYSHQTLTQGVLFSGFNFAIPSAPLGIEVRAVGYASLFGSEGSAQFGPVSLLLPGSAARYWGGPAQGTLGLESSESIAGGAVDLFDLTPTACDVNASGFGVLLNVAPTVYDGAIDVTITELQMRVHY